MDREGKGGDSERQDGLIDGHRNIQQENEVNLALQLPVL